jgi:uncharacterized protein (TIRG00374 family)
VHVPPDATTPARRSSPAGPRWFFAIKVAISLVLLWLLVANVNLSALWQTVRGASPAWMATALGLYFVMCVVSAWRWLVLLRAQGVALGLGTLTASFLVATFFNNFLPSNIGGDVVRIGDTARAAGSKTLATTVVLLDRAIGLLGLVLVAAFGATLSGDPAVEAMVGGPLGLWLALAGVLVLLAPAILSPVMVGRLLKPLERLHKEWIAERIGRLTSALERLRARPVALVLCFAGGVLVQLTLVAFYAAVARGLGIPITLPQLAVLVPLSFVIQMVPLSVNGFGVREATFTAYFAYLGLPAESALALSLIGAALVMLFSLSGAATYVGRGRRAVDNAAIPE